MEQHQRHCFIKLPGQRTVPMLVPYVENYFVTPEVVVEYERDIATLTGSKNTSEVDAMLEAQPSLVPPARELLCAADDIADPSDDQFFRE
jgi:hypothetical protein